MREAMRSTAVPPPPSQTTTADCPTSPWNPLKRTSPDRAAVRATVDLPDPVVTLDPMVRMVPMDSLEHKGSQAKHLTWQETPHPPSATELVLQGLQVRQGHQDQRDLRVHPASQDLRDRTANLGLTVPQAVLDLEGHVEAQVLRVPMVILE